MITLLIALAAAPVPVEGQATLQSCEMTAGGWVCHYSMPPVTLIGTTFGPQVIFQKFPSSPNQSPFAGLQFYLQGGVLVLGFNPGGFVFTRALAGSIGR